MSFAMMEEAASPLNASFATPANLKPTLSASRFSDLASPPAMGTATAPPQVLSMDQKLRVQRESQTAEHSVNTKELNHDMFVPDELGEKSGMRHTLSIRPYRAPLSISCPVCAKASMETPNANRPACACTGNQERCLRPEPRGRLPPPAPAVAAPFASMELVTSDSPFERFVLAGPGGAVPSDPERASLPLRPKAKSCDSSPRPFSANPSHPDGEGAKADFFIDLDRDARRPVQLRPKTMRSREASPMRPSSVAAAAADDDDDDCFSDLDRGRSAHSRSRIRSRDSSPSNRNSASSSVAGGGDDDDDFFLGVQGGKDIKLRPRKQCRSLEASPMQQSVASVDDGDMYFVVDQQQQLDAAVLLPNRVVSTATAASRPTAAAPLLPLMTPEYNARPTNAAAMEAASDFSLLHIPSLPFHTSRF